MSLGSGAQRTVLNSSTAGHLGSTIGTVPDGLLRDVMNSALSIRPDSTMNGEQLGWRGGEGEGEGGREDREGWWWEGSTWGDGKQRREVEWEN